MADDTEPASAADAVDAYVDWRTERGELAPASAEAIRYTLHRWVTIAGPITEWSAEAAAAWVNDPTMRAATRKARLGRLRPFCRWLVREGLLAEDLTEGIAPIRDTVGSPRDLDMEGVAKLLAVAPDERATLILLLMVQTGLRCGDVARIRIEDLDRRRHLLEVRAKGGRGEVTHTVPVPEEVWPAIEAQIGRLGRWSGPLIESYQRPGHALQGHSISQLVQRWCREAGLKRSPWDGVSAHALRHTMAQNVLDRGASLREVQFALGHRQQSTTEMYLRREPPGLRDAMEGRTYSNPTPRPVPSPVSEYDRVVAELAGSDWPVLRLGDHWRAGWPERFSAEELNPIWTAVAIGHALLDRDARRAEVVQRWKRGPEAHKGAPARSPQAYRRMLWICEALIDRPLWDEVAAGFKPNVNAWLDQVVASARDQNASR